MPSLSGSTLVINWHQKSKSDQKTCEDDLSYSASNFLSTIMQLHQTKIQGSPPRKSDDSTVTTVSTRTGDPHAVPALGNLKKCLECTDFISAPLFLTRHLIPQMIVFIPFRLMKMTILLMLQSTKWLWLSMPLPPTTSLTCLGHALFVVS